jgi:hypothetical protein
LLTTQQICPQKTVVKPRFGHPILSKEKKVMAKKDIINFNGNKTYGVNTRFSVGTRGDNGQADVMLIQALLRYITSAPIQLVKSQSGLTTPDLPKVNGICDGKTNQAILKFQQANAQKLMSVDGKVHPAIYEGRVIKSEMTDYLYQKKARPIMTITLLHLYAFYADLSTGLDYTGRIVDIAPDLKSWLN